MTIICHNTNRPRAWAREAFTLVELLLVMTILAILAGIVLPKMAGRGEEARVKAAITQISTFGTALGAYEIDNGNYPRGRDGLQSLMIKPRDALSWHGPYMEKDIPLTPWQKPYVYECPGKHNPSGYDLYAIGPDGTVYGNWTEKR
jgi:general secretion pathway protein G